MIIENDISKNIANIQNEINANLENNVLTKNKPTIIAVSKKQPKEKIIQAIKAGHINFGENQLQETSIKWKDLKILYPQIKLHFIGHVQSNKCLEIIKLFDVIHTIDSLKLLKKIEDYSTQLKKYPKLLIQINIGEEPQKYGIMPKEFTEFYSNLKQNTSLTIDGIMCIPPKNLNPSPYFALMYKISKTHKLRDLSIGMSDDFKEAIKFNATYLRIGTRIFGQRICTINTE